LLLLNWSCISLAHESRPLYIKLTSDSSIFTFDINLPNTVSIQNFPTVYIGSLDVNSNESWLTHDGGFRQKGKVMMPFFHLKGKVLSVNFPTFNPVLSTIVAISGDQEEEQILLIPPNENSILIPQDVIASDVRCGYGRLGVEHIWAGIDHLLFVVCLVIIAGFSRRLFDFIRLPIPPIEATIALSIVFLCYEIIHHHKSRASLTYRYPILVASSFGLLHGLGFAAVLDEIGLPSKYSFEALFFFNIGVELGQILFIGLLFINFLIVKRIAIQLLSPQLRLQLLSYGLQTAVYFVGILAAYWMFDRIL